MRSRLPLRGRRAGLLLALAACTSPNPSERPAPPAQARPGTPAVTAAVPTRVPQGAPARAAEGTQPPSFEAMADALLGFLTAHPDLEGIRHDGMTMFDSVQGMVVCYAPGLEGAAPLAAPSPHCWREPVGTEPVIDLGIYSATSYDPGAPRIDGGVHSFFLFLSYDGKRGAVREFRFPGFEARTVASLPVARQEPYGELKFVVGKHPRPERHDFAPLTPADGPSPLAMLGAHRAYTPVPPGRPAPALLDAIEVAGHTSREPLPTLVLTDTVEPGLDATMLAIKVGGTWRASPAHRHTDSVRYRGLVDASHVTGAPNTFMTELDHVEGGCDGVTTLALVFFEATERGLEPRGRIDLQRQGVETIVDPVSGEVNFVWLPGEKALELPAVSTRVGLKLGGTAGCVATERVTLERIYEGKERGIPRDFQSVLHASALHWTGAGWAPGACP